jgi:ACS family hexuronate transporter-like MFS transporter
MAGQGRWLRPAEWYFNVLPSLSTGAGAEAAEPRLPSLWRQVRWYVLALLFLVTVINFIHRLTLSVVAPVIRTEFHLSNTDYGAIVSAFMFGMMVGEFPVGWLMDRIGVRGGFSFSVVWWSLAAGLHAIARTAMQFSIFRFWMGTGECGNFSGGMKVVAEWFPARERAFAVGVFNAGSMIGSLVTPPLIVWIMLHFGWRMAFVGPSLLGFVWVLVWRKVYRPLAKHPKVTPEEAAYIRAGQPPVSHVHPPNRVLLRHAQGWGLILCRLLVGPVIQFYWFWMPNYLHDVRGLTLVMIGWSAWIPYLFGDVGSIGGGWFAGFMMRRGVSLHRARMITMWSGAACCAMSIGVPMASSAAVAIGFMCLVMFGHTWLSANMFAAISDIYPENAVGRMTALTGIAGGISGLVFPLLTGFLVDKVSYTPVFLIAAFMPAAGVLCLSTMGRKFERIVL